MRVLIADDHDLVRDRRRRRADRRVGTSRVTAKAQLSPGARLPPIKVRRVPSAEAVKEVADELGIEMPICHQVYQILYEGKSPRDAVQALMTRELKPENL